MVLSRIPFPQGGKAFRQLQHAYEKQLKKRPILTKSATSLVGFILGDSLAQFASGQQYDVNRTARFALFGATFHGPGCHVWYTLLEKIVPTTLSSSTSVVVKLLLDQALWSPFFTCIFYGVMKTMEGTTKDIPQTLKEKVIPTVLAGSIFWVPAHAVNFRFIPTDYRVLYVNVVNVFWTAVLCTLATSKPAAEIPVAA